MANQFANPTFLTGANDSMATIDTYSRNVNNNANSSFSSFKNIQDKVDYALKGSKVVQDASKFKNVENTAPPLDNRNVTDRLYATSPLIGKGADTFNAIKRMGSKAVSEISSASNTYGRAMAEINGIKSVFSSRNFESMSSISSAINQLSQNNFPLVLSDTATMIKVKSVMVQEAVGLKMPGAITALTCKVTDPVELNGIVKGVSGSVVQNSDIYALNEIATSPSCSHILLSQSPDVLGDFAANYSLPSGCKASDLPAIGNTITTSYDLIDPNWNKGSRGGVSLPNYTIEANSSMDFKAALRASNNSDEISYATGMGSSKEIAAKTSPSLADYAPTPISVIDSINMGSVKRIFPDGDFPSDDASHKWKYIGERDDYLILMNLYEAVPTYVKLWVGAA